MNWRINSKNRKKKDREFSKKKNICGGGGAAKQPMKSAIRGAFVVCVDACVDMSISLLHGGILKNMTTYSGPHIDT